MAVTYGFYNALNHDRLYDAIQMSSIFDGIIRDGIFSTIGTSMTVTAPEDGLYVNVGPGRAWFNHTWTLNDTEYPVEAEEAEVVLDRIDAVILEVNSAAEVRANSIKFLKGTPSSEPVKPTLTHNAEVNQYALAYVRIRAGQSTIFQSDVENAVGTEETPFVTGLMQQVSIENLILQWEAEFNDHFETWRNINEAEFEVWSQEMQDEYNAWILNQVNTYQTWFAGIQAEAGDDIDEVMAWFQHMKDQISEDAAIRLQEEIDELAESAEKGSVVTIHTINDTLYGKNCVISQDGQSRTARFDNTGTAVFESIPYVGQVTVTATDGTLTAVTYLTIPYFGRYSTNLAFWAATVELSTTSPEFFSLPIKIFKDNVLIETISFSALGAATYIATSEGTYKFSVTYDNADFDHTIVIDEETTYTVVINDWNATLNMQTSVDALYGRGITISKGGVTVGTTTFNGSGRATYKVHEPGTYHIVTSTAGGDTYQADVVVTEETAYPVDLGLPNGNTALPTDDIQMWLHCAGINDKGYTTLAEVLEDSVTFNALLGDSNACAYMARSTTWAGAGDGLVPVMTGDTTPSGTASASSVYSSCYAFQAFDGTAAEWMASASGWQWVQYEFPTGVTKKAVSAVVDRGSSVYSARFSKVKIQGSNDGTTFVDLTEEVDITSDAQLVEFTENIDDYSIYRFNCYGTSEVRVQEITLNGVPGITDSQYAMSILGRYNHACEAVLANEDWAEAIANSAYWQSVLNPLVPQMTSNTTPSGEAFSSSPAAGSAYYLFTDSIDSYCQLQPTAGVYAGYRFEEPVIVTKMAFKVLTGNYISPTVSLQASNDGSSWDTLLSDITTSDAGSLKFVSISDNNTAYTYYRLVCGQAPSWNCIYTLQVYGRHSSNALIPLVPTMTSNTTPSGEVFADSFYPGTSQEPYRAFDGDDSTYWNNSQASSDGYIGYDFQRDVVIKRFRLKVAYAMNNAKIQGWDGSDWQDIYSVGSLSGGTDITVNLPDNETAYQKYRLSAHANNQYSALSVNTLQFYGESSGKYIHSVPNDTVYYYDEGVETTLCTCDSNGVGEVDWSELPQGVMTLYSTTAKDPNNLSNDFSMTIRVTPNKVDAFLIPSEHVLYWYGWKDNNLESLSTANGYVVMSSGYSFVEPTYNTNNIFIKPNVSSNAQDSGVGTKNPIPKVSKVHAIMGIVSGGNEPGLLYTFTPKASWSNGDLIRIPAADNGTTKHYELTDTHGTNRYSAYLGRYSGTSSTMYAWWYEE